MLDTKLRLGMLNQNFIALIISARNCKPQAGTHAYYGTCSSVSNYKFWTDFSPVSGVMYYYDSCGLLKIFPSDLYFFDHSLQSLLQNKLENCLIDRRISSHTILICIFINILVLKLIQPLPTLNFTDVLFHTVLYRRSKLQYPRKVSRSVMSSCLLFFFKCLQFKSINQYIDVHYYLFG